MFRRTRTLLVAGFAVIALATGAHARPDHVVLGYSATWRDGISPAEDYNYEGLTHIARSFLLPKPDGSVTVPPGYFDADLRRLSRRHGVKLLMAIGGASETADDWVQMASRPETLKTFLDNLGRLMTEHDYDGIDVDWEPAPLTDADGIAYTTLLKALRTRFPKAVITTALPAGEYWVSHMNWADVVASIDYVNVMTYDYSGGWGGLAAHGSNLFPPGAYAPQPEYSVAEGMANLIKNRRVPPEKLLMGLIFPGYRFRAAKLGDRFPTAKKGYSDNVHYARTLDLFATGRYLSRWDEKANMPYLEADADQGMTAGGGDVISYESPESIRRKCDYAKSLGIAGVMIWHVGSDVSGRQAPLMDAVSGAFGVAPARLTTASLRRQAADLAADGPRVPPVAAGRPPATTGPAKSDPDAALARLRFAWGVEASQRWRAGPPPAAAK